MRAQAKLVLALAVLAGGTLPLSAQSTQALQGGFKPVQVQFQPIDTRRLAAPIPQFPGAQGTGGLGLLSLFGRNTPGFSQTVSGGFPQTAPTPQAPATTNGGLFGLGNVLKNVIPGFFRRSPQSPSAAPQTQAPLNLGVFQPIKPFTPRAN